MFAATISPYLDASTDEVSRLLSARSDIIFQDETFQGLVHNLDANSLRDTMHLARAVLDEHLPSLIENAKQRYQLDYFPLSGYMLSNWVVGYLTYSSEDLGQLYTIHRPIPTHIIRGTVPEILSIFDHMEEFSNDWKKAFATIVIPIASDTHI